MLIFIIYFKYFIVFMCICVCMSKKVCVFVCLYMYARMEMNNYNIFFMCLCMCIFMRIFSSSNWNTFYGIFAALLLRFWLIPALILSLNIQMLVLSDFLISVGIVFQIFVPNNALRWRLTILKIIYPLYICQT